MPFTPLLFTGLKTKAAILLSNIFAFLPLSLFHSWFGQSNAYHAFVNDTKILVNI
jgi:hypothetical protein